MKISKKSFFALGALGLFLLFPAAASSQTVFPENSLVRQRCIACHNFDEKGRMEVLEETRKTPEEWKVVVDRMLAVDGASLDDLEFEPVIKELSRYLCLTPEEMKEIAYINSEENSQFKEYPRDEFELKLMYACVRCHTFGKIKSHRFTLTQWAEIRKLHLGYYPTAVFQMREMDWAQVFQDLLDPLSKQYPFDDPKWHEWMKNRKDQDLTGEWTVMGFQPGAGYYSGAYKFEPNPAKGEDEYLIERTVKYDNGTVLTTSGTATLYSEYHLRYALAPTPLTGRIEGVFDLDADQQAFGGRWWTVVQDSNAYGDEKFCKTDGSPRAFGVYPRAMRAADGMTQKFTLVGVGLPEKVQTTDLKFSNSNMKAVKILESDQSRIVCQVQAASNIPDGSQVRLNVRGVPSEQNITIYDNIDAIKILPELGRARVSCGAAYPPQGVQFVARGINFGPDRKPGTDDDMILEPVAAKWWLEEEPTRENDDDLQYLNAPIINGLYSPVTTYGPISTREQKQEGVGLIAVGAAFSDEGRELKDRALLAVTEPDFVPHIK